MIHSRLPMMIVLGLLIGAVTLVDGGAHATALLAQDDGPDLGWHDTAEVTFVLTDGNARSTTLGFKNTLEHLWSDARFRFGAGGIRVEATTTDRTAVGDPADFSIEETDDDEVTAESYYLRTRYDRDFSDALFWYVGTGWDRNTFAGIDNRYTNVAGVGNLWYDTDVSAFRTDYGLTYTLQRNVDGSDDDFGGLRVSWDYWRELTETTRFESELIVDENLNDTADLRFDLINAVAVDINQALALQVSYQLLFDNEPSLESVPLLAVGGAPTGTTVLIPLDEFDSVFTVALVIGF